MIRIEWWSEYLLQDTCPSIKNILLLDSEGKRVAVKYYSNDWPTNSAKEAFEKAVFTKTQKTNARTEGKLFKIWFLDEVFCSYLDLHTMQLPVLICLCVLANSFHL